MTELEAHGGPVLLTEATTCSISDDDTSKCHHGHASVSQTVVNMAKTCMGTGCLVLPFAAKQGGILLHVFGLLGVGLWNVITVQRLCRCHDIVRESHSFRNTFTLEEEEGIPLLQKRRTWSDSNRTCNSTMSYESLPRDGLVEEEDEQKTKGPPKGTTTLVKLAWHAVGQWGANALDVIMVLYLIGVIVTYINGMRSFLSDTWFTTRVGFLDAFFLVAVMAPLSVVPHTGHLARASAMGLLVLLATFVVIAWYGFQVPPDNTTHSWQVLTDNLSTSSTELPTKAISAIPVTTDAQSLWLPLDGLAGVSSWFGIVVFGFGIVPLVFNFQEGMEEPHHIVRATWLASLAVAACYIVLGLGLFYLFPDIEGDVLHELPSKGLVPTLTRLSMVVVILVTAPLLIVPCGELLEGKLLGPSALDGSGGDVEDHDDHGHQWKSQTKWHVKALVRWGICLVCAAISTFVPGFVNVLSFVGCCCVAVVGFCLPPFLHLVLSLRDAMGSSNSRLPFVFESSLVISIFLDLALLLWGLLVTVVSTVYTFQEVYSGV